MGLHSKQQIADGIHTPIAFEYANAAARTGATGFVSTDLYKFARQTDDGSIWILTAVTPTWVRVGVSGLTATEVINTPAGNIAATTVQAAINELDTEKQGVLTNSAGLLAALSDETGTGLAVFNNAPTITNPVITNIAPAANFTVTQNAVVPFTSVNTGAVVDTLYLKTGNVGIGMTAPGYKLDVAGTTDTATAWGSEGNLLVSGNFANILAIGKTNTGGNAVIAAQSTKDIIFGDYSGGYMEAMRIKSGGNVGIGVTVPTAVLHLKAGTATANTAPLKFTAGTNLTTPEIGAMEFVDNGTTGHLYITLNVAGVLTRVQIA